MVGYIVKLKGKWYFNIFLKFNSILNLLKIIKVMNKLYIKSININIIKVKGNKLKVKVFNR